MEEIDRLRVGQEITWAKLASTRSGKVARIRSATLHSMIKPTTNEVIRDVMFCRMTDILSAIADFTSAASSARRAATRLELFSSSSNQPTSFLSIAAVNRVDIHTILKLAPQKLIVEWR